MVEGGAVAKCFEALLLRKKINKNQKVQGSPPGLGNLKKAVLVGCELITIEIKRFFIEHQEKGFMMLHDNLFTSSVFCFFTSVQFSSSTFSLSFYFLPFFCFPPFGLFHYLAIFIEGHKK